VFAAEFDFDKAIRDFVPQNHNCVTLKVGQTDTPLAAVWVRNGGSAYTSNENVVTVDSEGNVTAVGEGEAYVALVGSTGMNDVYLYTVEKAESANGGGSGTVIPPIGGSTENGNGQNDGSDSQQQTPSGTTKKPDATTKKNSIKDQYEKANEEYERAVREQESAFDSFNVMFVIIPLIFIPFLGLVLYLITGYFRFTKKTMATRVLPQRRITQNTVTAPVPPLTVCPRCGSAFGDNPFCAGCGHPKQVNNIYCVPIDKRVNAPEFEAHLNEWFAQNPYIYDCRIKLETGSFLGSPFLKSKFYVKSAVVEYSVASQPQQHQFGFAFLYKFRMFGKWGYDEKKQIQDWLANNPGCQVISTHSGYHSHMGDSYYTEHYNYVLYRKG
ncbi:MAG: hypothetical protein IKC69_00055, partial [Clostridia bacterium]|nr:hypothetical protein [Clostridia bacterium]